MKIVSGRMNAAHLHHSGWFRRFRFKGGVEFWFGKTWIMIEWR